VELGARFAAFLEFALEAGEDVLEGEAGLAGVAHAGAHAAHAGEALAWGPSLGEVELGGREGVGVLLGVVLLLGIVGVVLLLLLVVVLLCAGSDLGVVVGKDTDGAGGDLVVDDGGVVLADDVDAELLGEMRGRRRGGERDVRQYRRF